MVLIIRAEGRGRNSRDVSTHTAGGPDVPGPTPPTLPHLGDMVLREHVLKAIFFTPRMSACRRRLLWGLNAAVPGPPGVAKTSLTYKTAYENGFEVYVFTASSKLPSDRDGVPIVQPYELAESAYSGFDGERKIPVTTRGVPVWAVQTHERPTVVFFDDITAGNTPQMLASIVEVIQEHSLADGFHLGPMTRMMAAFNPRWCAAGGIKLSAPLANRLLFMPVMLNDTYLNVSIDQAFVKSWKEYYLGADDIFSPPPAIDHSLVTQQQDHVRNLWPSVFAEARAQVVSFIEAMPSYIPEDALKAANEPGASAEDKKAPTYSSFYEIPKPGSPGSASDAWCSPRTIDQAARAMATSRIHNLTADERSALVSGSVGDLWCKQFFTWRDTASLPTGESLIRDRGWVDWNFHDQSDKTYAVMASASSYLMSLERSDAVELLPEMVGMMLACANAGQLDEAARPLLRLSTSSLMRNKPEDRRLAADKRPVSQVQRLLSDRRVQVFTSRLREIDQDHIALGATEAAKRAV